MTQTTIRTGQVSSPVLRSCRFALVMMGFYAAMCLFLLRVNMSVAIICMTNDDEDDNNGTLLPINDCPRQLDKEDDDQDAEFNWNSRLQGNILSSFYFGYFVSQVPAGAVARVYGAKITMTVGMGLLVVSTMITPEVARISPYFLLALQVVKGIVSGVFYPCFQQFITAWIPPSEKGRMIGLYMSASYLGMVLSFAVSGFLCEYGFDGGWPSIFYIYGAVGMIWWIMWVKFVYETPQDHPSITKAELEYLETHLGPATKTKAQPMSMSSIPWRHIMTCKPIWACIIAETAYAWGLHNSLTSLPQYMEDVLYFDISANGVLSSLPYVGLCICSVSSGVIADYMISKKKMRPVVVRKLLMTVVFLPSAAFILGVAFVTCHQAAIAVVLLTLGSALTGFTRGGVYSNHMDLSPRYAGVIMGVTNSISTISGIVAPNVTSALTKNGTQSEWQRVWFLYVGIYVFGWIVYMLMASGDEQEWNNYGTEDNISTEVKHSEHKKDLNDYNNNEQDVGVANGGFDQKDEHTYM